MNENMIAKHVPEHKTPNSAVLIVTKKRRNAMLRVLYKNNDASHLTIIAIYRVC